MKIGVIGATGFVGCFIVDEFMDDYLVKEISRVNYNLVKLSNYKFDVLINAGGNSKKYEANNNPVWDFKESVLSVYNSIFDFNYKKYILISSIDAESKELGTTDVIGDSYGFNKHLAEEIVSQHCKDYSIIRCPAIIGKGAVKGIVKDIQKGKKIYLTPDSTLMLISANDMAEQLSVLLKTGGPELFERFYPSKNITIEKIGKILKKPIVYADELRSEYYDFPGNNYRLYKSSEQYLKDIL